MLDHKLVTPSQLGVLALLQQVLVRVDEGPQSSLELLHMGWLHIADNGDILLPQLIKRLSRGVLLHHHDVRAYSLDLLLHDLERLVLMLDDLFERDILSALLLHRSNGFLDEQDLGVVDLRGHPLVSDPFLHDHPIDVVRIEESSPRDADDLDIVIDLH